jgi:hypothetical protein
MLPQMGPPETIIWEFPGEDLSWTQEFAAFSESIECGRTSQPGLPEAAASLQIVEEVYRKSHDYHA